MRKLLYIVSLILINLSVLGQAYSQPDSVSFDKILKHFQETKGWNTLVGEITDSVSLSCLYQTIDFKVSISKKPIAFDFYHSVIENPYFKEVFDDYHKNNINYPVSYSVIYDDRLVSLFPNGRFVCHSLVTLERDLDFEKSLNTRKFRYHWIIDNKLVAISRNSIFIWDGNKWVKNSEDFPLSNQPKLYEDNEFVIFGDCHGEFGGTVYFYEKSTGETFFTESTCANTVIKKNDKYFVLAHLGHMMGSTSIKVIDDPRKLTKAKKAEINKTKEGTALGYTDKSKAYEIALEFWGVQLFSTFKYENRELFMVHVNERTFLAEIVDNKIQIVNPLFNNEIYTHNPITYSYGDYVLINLDFYGIARDKEVSVIILDGKRLIKLDWNKNHSR